MSSWRFGLSYATFVTRSAEGAAWPRRHDAPSLAGLSRALWSTRARRMLGFHRGKCVALAATELAVLATGIGPQLFEMVVGFDAADGAGARAHDDRVRHRAVGQVADAAQQRAGRDAGRCDEDVLPRDEIVRHEHSFRIETLLHEPLPLVGIARPELPLDSSAHALQRSRRDDALRRPADPVEQVHSGAALRRGDRRGDVAVSDDVHSVTGLPQLGDQLVVPVAPEHDDGEAP